MLFRRLELFLGCFAAVLAWAGTASACDFCAVYNAIESQAPRKGALHTAVVHQFTHFESNVRPEGFENYPGQHLESNITQIVGAYGVADDLSLQLSVPLIARDYKRIKDGRVEYGSENGVGDLSLIANYSAVRTHRPDYTFCWEFRGGVKLPTGDADRLGEYRESEEAERHTRHGAADGNLVGGDHLALGTGSWDFIAGTGAFLEKGRWFLSANLQYTYRQEGDFDYEFGDEVQWHFGPAYYLILEDEQTLALRLRAVGEHKGTDQINGADQDGSSEDRMYLGPELQYTNSSDWHASFGVDLPIRDGSASDEVVPQYRVLASLSRTFRS